MIDIGAQSMTAAADLFLAQPPPQTLPARLQMAFTLMTHIILVPLGVALPFITLVMNWRGLRKKDEVALKLARRWSVVMAIQFAVGVVSGTILSFEFGLLWPGLMGRWGGVFGSGFGIEAWAFFLEAILISIYLYGWRRLKPWTHFLVGLPLPAVALLGAFGILAANAWMNSPRGFTLDAHGNPSAIDIRRVLFTPLLGPQYWHFILAAYMAAGFGVASIYAVGWLRGRRDRYHKLGITVPFTVAAIATPIQLIVGDIIARAVFREQPVKFAAMELVWRTDTRVPEYIFGRLNADGTVSGGIPIPWLDSMLAGFSPDTRVQGLASVPVNNRPSPELATLVHTSFDLMVILGTLLFGLSAWYALAWWRHRDLPRSRWFFRCTALSGLAAILAIEFGWITTEVGRQPWIVYGFMRVSEAVTRSVGPATIWTTFAVIVVIYVLIATAFIRLLLRLRLRWQLADAEAAVREAHEAGKRPPSEAGTTTANNPPPGSAEGPPQRDDEDRDGAP
ncbi:cytochrome ubiquinol oxidase subunit I [Actinopolymorpha sp. B9G3]|uniref:cytochrome ubiquinol oxidase subunit I n=1 Tax=Actinopolymorpha sp. B9G3 TaxID=3158970 RepID=UPI0032D944E2